METEKNITGKVLIRMISCLFLSLFWVVFIWRFWEKGVYALGLNFFIFTSLILIMFVKILRDKNHFEKTDFAWIIPICLFIMSFLLYENPFIKGVNIFVLPILFAIFYNYSFIEDKTKVHWGSHFLKTMLNRIFSFFNKIEKSTSSYFHLLLPTSNKNRTTTKSIILGLVLLLVISFAVVIPLLSSADHAFGEKMQFFYDWIGELFAFSIVYRIIFFGILSVLLLSFVLSWGKKFNYEEKIKDNKTDSIVAGIFLGGILLIYIVFLWTQLENMIVGDLPVDFQSTVVLVKSGFWQLFFLSIINIIVYLAVFRKTVPLVQKILAGFTFASLLLLFSAGHRMLMYVINYGFSYEKFFALYTVIYCAIIFGFFLISFSKNKRVNILKFLIFLFLWMYSIVAILPLEQFIFRANLALSGRETSRIKLPELTILSSDVLNIVKEKVNDGTMKKRDAKMEYGEYNWNPWIKNKENQVAKKHWYEKNISNLINK